ncbi:phage tail protein [Paraeggerthella hongkongensis]|uniref:Phage tail protein n=1 Tax=Paraeggerthella hongkongensis TaxID=230658 RepID=A0A3N0BBL6_9ACTN|nr:phage tail protein [Paraeggerthella hongkongensis]RNL44733.1 phage tail protein [Paraeggerthella hongkongensis]
MADAVKNSNENVSAGKGVAGGYMFRAPLGTAKPTDFSTALNAAFKCCGFVSEDGVSFASESDVEELRDMNGDVMDASKTSNSEKFTTVLAEMKAMTQEIMYGEKNVTDAGGMITVHINGSETDRYVYVFELLLKNGRKWRRIVHEANVTELSDLKVASGELVGREATFTSYKDAETGDYYTDFIESTETAKTSV